MTWGDDLAEMDRWFTLTPADMSIVLEARGQPQRLERALMLTWMRAERTQASDVQTLPAPVITFVAEQLHLTPTVLQDYRSHQQTRSVAAAAIREHLEVRTVSGSIPCSATKWPTPDTPPRSSRQRRIGSRTTTS